jgi:hypothetical protein
MASASYNITIEQGATFSKTLIYKDSNGTPINMSDVAEVRGQMRPTIASSTFKDFTLTIDANPALGKIYWSMSDEDTAALSAPSTQYYDIELEFDDGTVKRILQGTVTVSPEVTRT